QDRCTRVGRRSGQDPRHTLGVLVVGGSGNRPARGDVYGLHTEQLGAGQVESDVDQLDATAIAKGVNGFESAKRHRQRGTYVRTVGSPSVDVDAAGQVDGDNGDARGLDVGEQVGRRRT